MRLSRRTGARVARRLVAATIIARSKLFYTAPAGRIEHVFEGARGTAGIDHPALGIQNIPIDRVSTVEALDAWRPVAGRCAVLEEGGYLRLGAVPYFPVMVLLEAPQRLLPCPFCGAAFEQQVETIRGLVEHTRALLEDTDPEASC